MRHRLAGCLIALTLLAPPALADSLTVAGSLADPVRSTPGLVVQRAGQASHVVSTDRIGELKPITQTVGFMTDHGERQAEWTGPLLWDVLTDSGAVEGVKPAEQVRLVVRVTGADGYTAVFALGEIAPQFAGRPIQIADRANGAPIPDHGLRLIVPGDKRGGRSVRNMIRIDIE
jgi:Oxidoreductase molybdopterin binding domain